MNTRQKGPVKSRFLHSTQKISSLDCPFNTIGVYQETRRHKEEDRGPHDLRTGEIEDNTRGYSSIWRDETPENLTTPLIGLF